jgi:hypothetical protein
MARERLLNVLTTKNWQKVEVRDMLTSLILPPYDAYLYPVLECYIRLQK